MYNNQYQFALIIVQHQQIDFPFVVLLVSGGHCLLVLAQNIDNWKILGKSLDVAPGNVFDQVSIQSFVS